MSSNSPHGRGFAHDIGDLDAEGFDAPVEPEVLPDRAPDGVRRRSYDKAFEPAVARGLLTVQAAWARGSREAYAIGLQHRYQLTSTLALEVADNSRTLLEALEILDRQSGGALSELTGARKRFPTRLLPLALVVAGLLFLVGRYGQQQWENQGRMGQQLERLSFAVVSKLRTASAWQEPIAPPPSRPEVRRDEFGRVTQVSGATPSAVLDEICRLASASAACPWMEVRPTEPRRPGLRIGRFASDRRDGEAWSILMRRNRSSGRWFAGTGLQPLQPFPADDRRAPQTKPDGTGRSPSRGSRSAG